MEDLIPAIAKLQDVSATLCNKNKFGLPQIVVVGSQSAGKSSVIEGIVGRDFLPRGTGLVTRCPLLIHLHYTPASSPKRRKNDMFVYGDWAEFGHSKQYLFDGFDKVRKEIEERTNQLCGSNKGITDHVIVLNIFSELVVDLSLIDLPGIVKNPIGDQPPEIEEQVRSMILKYITNPKSIILAVTPANQDFATSEPIKLAREVDPNGDRTLGVLTKLDLMDQGTDAMEVLMNKLLHVKLGIIGVVNRSQADINAKKSMADCQKDETAFLKKKYPSIASRNGIPYLAKSLSRLLVDHIKTCLPGLKKEIADHSLECEEILNKYGKPIADKKKTLLYIINQFVIAYRSALDGNPKNTLQICGGARICKIFYEHFAGCIDKIDAMDGLSANEIITATLNASGIRPSILIPETAFDLLMKTQIKQFEKQMILCVDVVHKELKRISNNCGDEIQQEMKRFPQLRRRILENVNRILEKRVVKTKTFVQDYLKTHLASINTKHSEFREVTQKFIHKKSPASKMEVIDMVTGSVADVVDEMFNKPRKSAIIDLEALFADDEALTKSLQSFDVNDLTPDKKQENGIIEELIRSYFLIIQKQVKDIVPKAIMNFLINYLCENLQNELIRALYDPQNIDALMVEGVDVEEKRREALEMLDALKKATLILSEINELRV